MNNRSPLYSLVWIFCVLSLLTIVCAWVYSSFSRQQEDLYNQNINTNFYLLTNAIKEHLVKKDYDSVDELVQNWGNANAVVVAINLTSKNGFRLAQYKAADVTKKYRNDSRVIYYSYDGSATLNMRSSMDEMIRRKRYFLYLLLGVFVLVTISLFYLYYSNIRMRTQQKELKESQDQTRLLLNSTEEAICGLDSANQCTFANRAAVKMLKCESENDLIGKCISEILIPTNNKNINTLVNSTQYSGKITTEEIAHFDRVLVRCHDLTCFLAELWIHPIYDNKKHVGAVATFFDVTEHQKALDALFKNEQDLAVTLHSIGDAVITTDANGLVTRMNSVAEKLTEWSIEEARGKGVKDIFRIFDASTMKPIENPIEKVLETGQIVTIRPCFPEMTRDCKFQTLLHPSEMEKVTLSEWCWFLRILPNNIIYGIKQKIFKEYWRRL